MALFSKKKKKKTSISALIVLNAFLPGYDQLKSEIRNGLKTPQDKWNAFLRLRFTSAIDLVLVFPCFDPNRVSELFYGFDRFFSVK